MSRRLVAASLLAMAGLLLLAPGAVAGNRGSHGVLQLPAPQRDIDPLAGIGLARDRLLRSVTPGDVTNREAVTVALGPNGAPQQVVDVQRLALQGTGNYVIRERGPARESTELGGTVPPVLELGTVVWQGFSPGHRALAARLTLDPGLEAQRLPLAVQLHFTNADGESAQLRPGLIAPSDGTLRMTLANRTATVMTEPVGTATLHPLADALDTLLRAARHPVPGPPPSAGQGLPTAVPGRLVGQTSATAVAPLRVSGTLKLSGSGASITGAGVTATRSGARIAGTLDGQTTVTASLHAGQRLSLNLSVQPYLDPRLLTPPVGNNSWRQWARHRPGAANRRQASATLMTTAASAARAAEYTPYLQADVPGPDRATFRYVAAPPATPRGRTTVMQAHPAAIAAVCVAAFAIVGNLLLLRRRL